MQITVEGSLLPIQKSIAEMQMVAPLPMPIKTVTNCYNSVHRVQLYSAWLKINPRDAPCQLKPSQIVPIVQSSSDYILCGLKINPRDANIVSELLICPH